MCCRFNRGPPTVQSRTKMRHFDGVWGSIVRSHSVAVFSKSSFEENLFYFQLFSQGRGLTGLKNMGNTCYMSSTIQCLSNTPVLINYLIDKKYLHDINRCVSLYFLCFSLCMHFLKCSLWFGFVLGRASSELTASWLKSLPNSCRSSGSTSIDPSFREILK